MTFFFDASKEPEYVDFCFGGFKKVVRRLWQGFLEKYYPAGVEIFSKTVSPDLADVCRTNYLCPRTESAYSHSVRKTGREED